MPIVYEGKIIDITDSILFNDELLDPSDPNEALSMVEQKVEDFIRNSSTTRESFESFVDGLDPSTTKKEAKEIINDALPEILGDYQKGLIQYANFEQELVGNEEHSDPYQAIQDLALQPTRSLISSSSRYKAWRVLPVRSFAVHRSTSRQTRRT